MMTTTQVFFLWSVVYAGPAYGALNGFIHGWWAPDRAKFFLAPTALSWGVWLMCAVLARLLHPEYPREGPSEGYALLYVVPGHIAGLAAIALMQGLSLKRAAVASRCVLAKVRVEALIGLLMASFVVYMNVVPRVDHSDPNDTSDALVDLFDSGEYNKYDGLFTTVYGWPDPAYTRLDEPSEDRLFVRSWDPFSALFNTAFAVLLVSGAVALASVCVCRRAAVISSRRVSGHGPETPENE